MTKAEIVNEISNRTGYEKNSVQTIVEAFMDAVKKTMIDGENVYLRGFGSYIVKHRAEKTARNISKNQTITIKAHNIPDFKPCKDFKKKKKKNTK